MPMKALDACDGASSSAGLAARSGKSLGRSTISGLEHCRRAIGPRRGSIDPGELSVARQAYREARGRAGLPIRIDDHEAWRKVATVLATSRESSAPAA
jgi:hypothetical protein